MEFLKNGLWIREIRQDDFASIHEISSQIEVCRYQAWGPNSEDDTKEYIKSSIAEQDMSNRSCFNFVVESVSEKRVLGTCAIFLKENDVGEIGFSLGEKSWGQGFGTIIAKTLRDAAIELMNVKKVIATCDILNKGSNALLQKVGFEKVKIVEKHMKIKGRDRDTVFYEYKK
ncbi:hypothetical protein A9Q84_14850 [Halobacteriovorax marinus]|uniref:N-acetyltransferase domain-containing protein n=1 Tax=Halobacteriovorax marinus TaxID=97084 RepID=A0A1Y5F5E2_9BACT|nr:hypothetical protein A9Q84_14850 [Halobacteriovorax marinus]